MAEKIPVSTEGPTDAASAIPVPTATDMTDCFTMPTPKPTPSAPSENILPIDPVSHVVSVVVALLNVESEPACALSATMLAIRITVVPIDLTVLRFIFFPL